MNKYLFIFGFAGMALFSACSTSDDLTAEEPRVTPPVEETKETAHIIEASQNSEIPITLGVGESRGITRAVLNPGEGGVFSTETGTNPKFLGVFCLATDYQSSTSTPPIENNWTNNDETGLIVRMKNVPAKVEDGVVTFLNPTTLSDPTPTSQKWYYPMNNWMKYNFYAYYPREDDATISFTKGGSGALVKYLTIDGSQDVIWGKANQVDDDAPDGSEPYCAKYIRWRIDNPAGKTIEYYYPKMEFKHLLAQFNFSIEPVDDAAWTAISGAGGMAITNMYISNAISNLQLIVANKANSLTEGKLSKKDDTTAKLYIKANGSDDNLFDGSNKIDIAATPVSVPGYIMLPPSNVGTEDYELCLNYSIGGTPQAEPMRVIMTRAEGFAEGEVYNIVVKVKVPTPTP